MKKLSLILTFVLVALAIFALSVFAAQPNVANQATITTTSGCWVTTDSLTALVDGNREVGHAASHSEGSYELLFDFSNDMKFEKIVLVVNGKGSTPAGSWSEVQNKAFDIKVIMTDSLNTEVYNETHKTGDLTEITIVPSSAVKQMKLVVSSNWTNSNTIWEVEMYGCTMHDCEYELTETLTEPSCGVEGEGVYTCTVCSDTKNDAVPATGNHSWGEGVETTAPTAETAGEMTYTCTVCSQTKTEVIPAVGHNWDAGTVIAPTCVDKGYTVYKCQDEGCEASYTAFETASLGHAFDDGVPLKHATLTSEGTMIYSCTREGCDEQYISLIPQASISDSQFTIGLDNIVSVEEVIVGDANPNRDYKKLFDGINVNASWSPNGGGGWWAPAGSSITIVFDEEYYILSTDVYLWSNWKGGSIEFFDAQGNVVASVVHNGVHTGFNIQDGSSTVISACVGKLVKSVRLTNTTAGGEGNALDFQEIVLVAHKHVADDDSKRYDETAPTCGELGSYKKYCYVCEIEVTVNTPATGEHTLSSIAAYANGYYSHGAVTEACANCSYSKVTEELKPLFVSLGYSVKEFGTVAIAHNILIDQAAVAHYESIAQKEIKYGIVGGVYTDASPLTVNDGAVTAAYENISIFDASSSNFGFIFCKITGISLEQSENQLVCGGYVYDGDNLYYLNDNAVSLEAQAISYSQIIAG